jgi:hypothetical protein
VVEKKEELSELQFFSILIGLMSESNRSICSRLPVNSEIVFLDFSFLGIELKVEPQNGTVALLECSLRLNEVGSELGEELEFHLVVVELCSYFPREGGN